MDYHRLRPQSVLHASPRRGVSQAGDGYITIDLPAPVVDPEADADRVYQILTDAMEPVRHAMLAIRNDLGKAADGTRAGRGPRRSLSDDPNPQDAQARSSSRALKARAASCGGFGGPAALRWNHDQAIQRWPSPHGAP